MMPLATRQLERKFLDTCAKIEHGRLRVVTPEGTRHDFGSGGAEAELVLRDWATVPAIAARGDIGFGEAYTAGLWETSSVEAVATVALRNLDQFGVDAEPRPLERMKLRAIDRLLRSNSQRGAARNIRAHYDVGNEFYQLWLDPSMTYSSAIFAPGDDDLSSGQARKYNRILDRIGDAEQVLEVGCGWGGFAETAAERGHNVTGITISPSQKGYADARLDGRAEIRLQDYRKTTGKYDALVSIEMVEAVGQRYWPTYFATLRDRLKDGGRAVVQAITVPDEQFPDYAKGSDYIRHYTFPGGMLLSNSVIETQARQAGLKMTDNFAFGKDYGATCRAWDERLTAAIPRIRNFGYGEGFLRSWRYYLGICAAAFETGRADVVQVELAHA